MLVADLTTGSSGMSAKDVIAAVAAGPASTEPNAVIVWSLRLPMALTALLVGASLSLAGLSIQTITANALQFLHARDHFGRKFRSRHRDHRRTRFWRALGRYHHCGLYCGC
ncbi:MAG: iron chelate uptake ABC transporter family permease subunit [Duodenibacillus massiliensis]